MLTLGQYGCPPHSRSGCRAGLSSSPLVLFLLYYKENATINPLEIACDSIEGTVRSRFVAREDDILVLRCGFSHIGDDASRAALEVCCTKLATFVNARQSNSVNLVMMLNTHARPSDGGLLYKPEKVATLDAMLDTICHGILFSSLRQSMLFIPCCGGLVKHALREIANANDRFGSVFAFGAPSLDPVLISNQFIANILYLSIFGREKVIHAFYRAATVPVLHHTPVFVAINKCVYRIRIAHLRSRPNGEELRCCNQTPQFRKVEKGHTVLYRCQADHHDELAGTGRYFRVRLLEPEANRRWIYGEKCDRCIFDVVDYNA
ncbi:hypothetical protein LXA43DRAFT_899252 [Ganoderma leucocontextum]|nr:hypothetical protein LXA43DRAFT_899252 [Ganoderma leucocontextum]